MTGTVQSAGKSVSSQANAGRHAPRTHARPGVEAGPQAFLLPALTALLVCLALLLGGGTVQGLASDALVQLASLPVLAMALWQLAQRPLPAPAKAPLAVVGAVVLLPLLQLVPLPPDLWTWLPGRERFAQTFAALGLAPSWHPLSLDPAATWRAWLALLPPLAVFAAVLCLGRGFRRLLSLVFLGFAVLGLLLGLAQLMQGPDSPLRFHPVTNPGSSVGLFANRNHHAAMLYGAASFAAAWTVGLVQARRINRTLGAAAGVVILAALLLGVGMAQSRAGVLLALAAAGLGVLLAARLRPTPFRRRGLSAVAAAAMLGALFVAHYAPAGLMERFEASPIDDYRFAILGVAREAASAFQPFGSGFGTFQAVYLLHDRPEALIPAYVNRAHNDWLEAWIEGGWLAAAIAAAFLAWFARASWRAWRADANGRPLDALLARAASISVGLLLLHSLADYPLRTTGVTTFFAFCCALLVEPVRAPARQGRFS